MQELQSVHARQLEVEHDHVGAPAAHLVERQDRVGRRLQADAGLAREDRAHRHPHHGGVVDDQHAQIASRGRSCGDPVRYTLGATGFMRDSLRARLSAWPRNR
jgi:hypothetical protein